MGKSFRDELWTGTGPLQEVSQLGWVLTEVGEIGLHKSQTPNPDVALWGHGG